MFLLVIYLVLFIPVDYATFLSDIIPVLGSLQKVLDGVASFEMDLDPHPTAKILKAFTKPFHKYGPTPGRCQNPPPPLWHHVYPFTHPFVPSKVSVILVSITSSNKPDKAMLFWHGKSLSMLMNNFCSMQFIRS